VVLAALFQKSSFDVASGARIWGAVHGVLLLLAAVGHAPGLMAGVGFGTGLALLRTSRYIERWEVGHGAVLLREPGTRRYYIARPE
jgi:hypothetical protein